MFSLIIYPSNSFIMAQRLSIIITFILIGLKLFSQTSQNDFSFKSPDSIGKLKSVKLWSTQYFIHKFDSKGNIPIIDQDGNPMNLYADTCNFCEAALEGTAYVTDSLGVVTIINFAKTGKKALVNCRLCKKYFKSKLEVESWGKTLWKKTTGFGDGVKNYKLIPFRTIAVDTKVIPYGTVLFIPQLKGKTIKLPNGVTVIHDGYLFAGDTGGAGG